MCLYVCALESQYTWRPEAIPQSWHYRHTWLVRRVLRCEVSWLCRKQQVFFSAEPSLQSLFMVFWDKIFLFQADLKSTVLSIGQTVLEPVNLLLQPSEYWDLNSNPHDCAIIVNCWDVGCHQEGAEDQTWDLELLGKCSTLGYILVLGNWFSLKVVLLSYIS